MDTKAHWEAIYHEKAPGQMGWYQPFPELSLHLIQASGVPPSASIIDVGGGTSSLVDHLLEQGFQQITVLDVSAEALLRTRRRLGPRESAVTWLEADIMETSLPAGIFDLWHDRALFHFLTQQEERSRYVRSLAHSLRPDGYVIIATYGLDGPKECSGLPVIGYDPPALQKEMGPGFKLLHAATELHQTPFGSSVPFTYCLFNKLAS